jgi:capsular polysaccharide biosynthesis protein
MDLKQLIVMLKRWYWLLILGTVLGVAGGIILSRIQTPVYEAAARTLVMRAPDQSNSALAYLSPDELAATFSQLIVTQPVLDSVSSQLGVKVHKTQIQIQIVTNSQIIKVIVDDNDPQMSSKIANTLVKAAIKQYVDLQTGLYVSSEIWLDTGQQGGPKKAVEAKFIFAAVNKAGNPKRLIIPLSS